MVVGDVVDAAQRQRRPEMVALRRVVVDHVEDHLDAGAVEALHHGLELADLAAGPSRGVAHVGREERDRVVAPVVGEAAVGKYALGDGVVHRHQLDRGDAERDEVLQDRVHAEPEIGSAQHLRDVGV